MTEQITTADWQAKVIEAQKPVLVDFSATWCGPCRAMAPIVDELASSGDASFSVYAVDIDQEPAIAQRYGVMSVPTFIVFKQGEPAAVSVGRQPKEQLLALLG